jgi:serine protease AprX
MAYRQANMLNTDLLHQMGFRGAGITVSSMDNGFVNVDHIAGFDSIRPHIMATWDFVHNQENVYDDGGHGTNTFSCMAGNIPGQMLGTAPDANYFLLETEDNGAEWVMEEYNWAAAAEWADSAGADIFTTSLGYTTFDYHRGDHSYNDLTGNKTVMTRAGNIAFSKGILVINSAGNEGKSGWHYISVPADGDSIMAIGAVDSSRTIADFSGRGPTKSGHIKPDICAQGVKSAVIATDGTVGFSGGTSFSCPTLAGSAASLWGAFPEKSAREIFDAIVISADRFWTPDNDYGYGIPNFYTAYLLLKSGYNGNIVKVSDDVIAFPNPFSNQLSVSLYSDENATRKIELFDLTGRKVLSQEIFIRDKSFSITTLTEAANLSTGEYILRLDGNKKLAHRIMKK